MTISRCPGVQFPSKGSYFERFRHIRVLVKPKRTWESRWLIPTLDLHPQRARGLNYAIGGFFFFFFLLFSSLLYKKKKLLSLRGTANSECYIEILWYYKIGEDGNVGIGARAVNCAVLRWTFYTGCDGEKGWLVTIFALMWNGLWCCTGILELPGLKYYNFVIRSHSLLTLSSRSEIS